MDPTITTTIVDCLFYQKLPWFEPESRRGMACQHSPANWAKPTRRSSKKEVIPMTNESVDQDDVVRDLVVVNLGRTTQRQQSYCEATVSQSVNMEIFIYVAALINQKHPHTDTGNRRGRGYLHFGNQIRACSLRLHRSSQTCKHLPGDYKGWMGSLPPVLDCR